MPCPRNLRSGRKDAGRSDTRSVCGDHHDRRRRKMPDIASSSAPPTTDANGAAIERPNNQLAIIPPLPDRRTARTPRPLAIPRQSTSDAEWLNLCRVSSCHCPVGEASFAACAVCFSLRARNHRKYSRCESRRADEARLARQNTAEFARCTFWLGLFRKMLNAKSSAALTRKTVCSCLRMGTVPRSTPVTSSAESAENIQQSEAVHRKHVTVVSLRSAECSYRRNRAETHRM
jgi:hypothetical protein